MVESNAAIDQYVDWNLISEQVEQKNPTAYSEKTRAKKQLKDLYKTSNEKDDYQVDVGGVFISEKLITKESKRSCPICNTYSFKSNDDVYMSKFDCCFKCYIQWVEGREARWKTVWRPKK